MLDQTAELRWTRAELEQAVGKRLEEAVGEEKLLPPFSSLSRCMKIGLWKDQPVAAGSLYELAEVSADVQTQMEMTVVARWTLRPRLMSVAGGANVAIWGEKDPQLQVVIDPDRLRTNGVKLDMVLQTVRDATAVGSGGFVDTAYRRLALRHIPAVYSPQKLGQVVVSYRNGFPLAIRDSRYCRSGCR